MSKLDDVIDNNFPHVKFQDLAKEAIKDLFLELVGEDKELVMYFDSDKNIRETCYMQGINETKLELRNKIGEL